MARSAVVVLTLLSIWFGWRGYAVTPKTADAAGSVILLQVAAAYEIASAIMFAAACVVALLSDLVKIAKTGNQPEPRREADGWGVPDDAADHRKTARSDGAFHPLAPPRNR